MIKAFDVSTLRLTQHKRFVPYGGITKEYAKKYQIKIFKILRSEFGFGKTRNLGVKLARGEYLVCITQDVIPVNNNWLANLLVNLKKEAMTGAFGRQLCLIKLLTRWMFLIITKIIQTKEE